MPREYFSVEGITPFAEVPQGGKIHVIGVCGVAMANLAVALSEIGYQVSGSDKQFYDPMAALLASSSVKTFVDFAAENLAEDLDLVVIANAPFYENPEVQAVEQRKLPYTIFPQLLGEALIGERHSIVVCGTHGKSTTTGMIASVLYKMQLDPSYFIGGVAEDLPGSLHIGSGAFSVVEGDEYISSFFARVPKFNFYKPTSCIINALEFDHADIYTDIDKLKDVFRSLIQGMSANNIVLHCTDFPELAEMINDLRNRESEATLPRFISFGSGGIADYRILSRKQVGAKQFVKFRRPDSAECELQLPLTGEYNARNALACYAVLFENGIDSDLLIKHLSSYRSVKRRQTVRYDDGKIMLVEDFAHHPTAVAGTVRAMREAYPEKRIWAVFEPRSNTSRRKVFQSDYVKAFAEADIAVLLEVKTQSIMNKGEELIDVAQLGSEIEHSGIRTLVLPEPDQIYEQIVEELQDGDLVLIMSNGSFGNIQKKLEDFLSQRA